MNPSGVLYRSPGWESQPGVWDGGLPRDLDRLIWTHHPLARKIHRFRQGALMTMRRHLGWLSEDDNHHGTRPCHRHAMPTKSCLRSLSASPRPGRTVTFDTAEAHDDTESAAQNSHLSPAELADLRRRNGAHNRMWLLIEKFCLAEGRFVKSVTRPMSQRRRAVATASAQGFWESLLEDGDIDATERGQRLLRLHMMEMLFFMIHQRALSNMKNVGDDGRDAKQLIKEALALSDALATFFMPFERELFGEGHVGLRKDMDQLCASVVQLRGLCKKTDGHSFTFYVPCWRKGSERRLPLLRNGVRVYETLGADRRDAEGCGDVRDVAKMTLCGGLMRKTENMAGPDGARPRHGVVCESKAVVVAYRPARDEVVESKMSSWGGTEQARASQAHRQAMRNADEVREEAS